MKKNIIIQKKPHRILGIIFPFIFLINCLGQNQNSGYQLYPDTYKSMPDLASPSITKDSTEVVLVFTKANEYALVPVTVENGKPLLYSHKIKSLYGKDKQLETNKGDFPTLAKTGLHNEDELDKKNMITGIPVHIITIIGRPNGFSHSGFMAKDEDIISVLKVDNHFVKSLGLTHPQMAKPLFHIWNIVLKEIELGNWARFYDNIKFIFYNSHKLSFKANGTKGWQLSIFQDEIQGRYDIDISRGLTIKERGYLKEKYSHLSESQIAELERKLSSIHFSEMLPYYIMRYGFYEGHTDYRCHPVAIAFIFGLKSLEEIDKTFEGNLYNSLTDHYLSDKRN